MRSGEFVSFDGRRGVIVGFDGDMAQVVWEGARPESRMVRFPDGTERAMQSGAVAFDLVDPSRLEVLV